MKKKSLCYEGDPPIKLVERESGGTRSGQVQDWGILDNWKKRLEIKGSGTGSIFTERRLRIFEHQEKRRVLQATGMLHARWTGKKIKKKRKGA